MNNNTLNHCYLSYYAMWIYPVQDGRARVSTCCNNTFRPENRLVVEKNIKDTWNSKQFQFQRKLISKKDWSFCQGASCADRPPLRNGDNLVKSAIALHKTKLDYFARKIIIFPSLVCNNNCYFCFQAEKRNKGINYQLRDSLIKEIKEDIIPQAKHIILSGGEPFFSSMGLELIDWVVSRYPEKKFEVQTNGTLLHQFGLDKIIKNNVGLRVTMYGMNRKTYRSVTGRDNFDSMFYNVNQLIKARYKKIRLAFILCRKSVGDLEDFCNFIEKNENIRGSIRNNIFEGRRYWKFMRKFENKYSHLYSRISFWYRDKKMSRRGITKILYNS